MKRILIMLLIVLLNGIISNAQDQSYKSMAPITSQNGDQLVELGYQLGNEKAYFLQVGQGRISDLEISADGKTLGLATAIGIWLYELNTDDDPRFIQYTTTPFTALAFHPTEPYIATISRSPDDVIRIFDYTNGFLVKQLFPTKPESPTRDSARDIAFSPDGKFLATGHESGKIWIWSASTEGDELGLPISIFEDGRNNVYELTFSQDSQRIWTNQVSFLLRAWNVSNGAIEEEVAVTEGNMFTIPLPYVLSYSPDGKYILLASRGFSEGMIQLFDPHPQPPVMLWQYDIEGDTPDALAFAEHGRWLAVGTEEGKILILDSNGELKRELSLNNQPISYLRFIPNSNQLVSISDKSIITIWDIALGTYRIIPTQFHESIHDIAIAPDSESLLFAVDTIVKADNSSIGAIVETSLTDDTSKASYFKQTDTFTATTDASQIAISPDGQWIAAIVDSKWIYLANRQTGEEKILPKATSTINALVFSPDNQHLVSILKDDVVQLWDIHRGELLNTTEGIKTGFTVIFHPDSKYVIVGDNFSHITILDSINLQVVREITLEGRIESLDISADGQTILVAGNKILLVDFNSGEVQAQFGAENRLARFGVDDSVIISGTKDSLTVWDTCTQNQLFAQSIQRTSNQDFSYRDDLLDLEVSPDGRFIITYFNDGTLRYWGIPDTSKGDNMPKSLACLITPTSIPTLIPIPTATLVPLLTVPPTMTQIPTLTPIPSQTPIPTPTLTPLPVECQNAPIPRLILGQQGRVLDDDPSPINMRDGAGTSFNRTLEVPAGTFFTVLQGAICADGYFWYQINYNDTIGWIAEGDLLAYYTEPLHP